MSYYIILYYIIWYDTALYYIILYYIIYIYIHPYYGFLILWSYCSSICPRSPVPAEVNPVLAGYFSRTATALMSKYKTEAPKQRSGAHHAPVVYSG